jgi:ABC-type sugar transport system ATPase subunit
MQLLASLDKPTKGRVLVDGNDVTGIEVRQRSVAMVYQQFINYPSLTVYENIAAPLRVQGKPKGEIEKRVAEAARLPRLEPFLSRTPLQFSGGQQQRTAIARAGEGRRSCRARRTLGQPRRQAARGVACRANQDSIATGGGYGFQASPCGAS